MSAPDKYSLKKHLLEATSRANALYIEDLKSLPQWSFNGVKHSPTSNSMRLHSYSYEATPDCILGVELLPIYDDVIYIERLIGSWGPNMDYDPECEGKGYGTQCMQTLMQIADKHDVQLSLEAYAFATNEKRPNTKELEQWYMRLGFEHSPQDNGMLVYNYIRSTF